jgi:cytochrome b
MAFGRRVSPVSGFRYSPGINRRLQGEFDMSSMRQGRATILIWDLPLRLFHWLLVACIAVSWYTVEVSGDMRLHMLSGYAILTLVLFRIAWAFAGPPHARWRGMLYRPSEISQYAKRILKREPSGYAGHSPLGALSVLAMLLVVSLQAATGLFATDGDFYAGPLNAYIPSRTASAVTEVHEVNFNLLLALIALHVAAILFYLLFKRENLITAMITGRKGATQSGPAGIEGSMLGRAALLAAAAAALVVFIVNGL